MIRWAVVGLGNPGKQYQNTRHNMGFAAAECLGQVDWKFDKKFNADVAQMGEILIMKPQTFMNRSGNAVSAVMRFYKIPLDHLIVIHDDLDIPMGMTKMGFGKGPKVHNGLDSVDAQLGSKDYWRVRIGIDNRTTDDRLRISPSDFVLKQLSKEELQLLEKPFSDAVLRIREIVKNNGSRIVE